MLSDTPAIEKVITLIVHISGVRQEIYFEVIQSAILSKKPSMSLKITIRYEKTDKVSKIQVPKSWASKRVGDVANLYVKAWNTKNDDDQLVTADMHLVDEHGNAVFSDEVVSTTIGDRCDYVLKHGAHIKVVKKEEVKVSASGKPLVKCRNYGCQQMFDEEDNPDGSCVHHTGPPIFHDTIKFWSCCKDRKAYDFEGFQEIKGCAAGKHNTADPGQTIGASPNAPTNTVFDSATKDKEGPKLLKIEEMADTGPTGAADAQKIMNTRKSSRKADGTARCQRKGCTEIFLVEGNHETACTYHKGQPIFHDAVKYWSCCDTKKCYDFDEFMAVPGCTTGYHDDGVIEL